MNVITWIRNFAFNEEKLTQFQEETYAKFEKAVEESDVIVYVYDNKIRGEQLIRQNAVVHVVTAKNLVSFRKLVRHERRKVKKIIDKYDGNKS